VRALYISFAVLFAVCALTAGEKTISWRDPLSGTVFEVEVVENEIVANLDTLQGNYQETLLTYGLTVKRFVGISGWAALSVQGDPADVLRRIMQDRPSGIREVEPNIIYKADAILGDSLPPNDPLVGDQWYLDAVHWFDARTSTAPGEYPIQIGVLDSGFPMWYSTSGVYGWVYHEDIGDTTGDFILGKDFSTERGVGVDRVQDLGGHATPILGIIRAKTNNEKGVAGLTDGYPIKILVDQIWNRAGHAYSSDIAEAIKHQVDAGSKVINLSGGGPIYSAVMEDAISYARDHDVIVVTSAGNEDAWWVNYPARLARIGAKSPEGYKNVLNVGAIDETGNRAWFSSYDPTLMFVAPGVSIMAPTPDYPFDIQSYGWTLHYFGGCTGTSFSCPIGTSLVAMMRSKDLTLTHEDIRAILIETVDRVGDSSYIWNGDGWFNVETGFGGLNFYAALKRVDDLLLGGSLPVSYRLEQNYPNPFNAGTIIRYDVPQPGNIRARLVVYDVLGRRVATLVDGYEEMPGVREISFTAIDLASGIYFYRLELGEFIETRKMILLR